MVFQRDSADFQHSKKSQRFSPSPRSAGMELRGGHRSAVWLRLERRIRLHIGQHTTLHRLHIIIYNIRVYCMGFLLQEICLKKRKSQINRIFAL